MTETTTSAWSEPDLTPPVQPDPSDVMLTLIATLLAPMFLVATDGDPGIARIAAIQAINAYRARDQAGVLAVAQIVAFGLAALGSLGLSMTDDLSLTMTMRLRSNANALNRSAEQNRRVVGKRHGDDVVAKVDAPTALTPEDERQQAEVVARVAAARQAAAAALIETPTEAQILAEATSVVKPPIPVPTQPTTPIAAPDMSDKPLTPQQEKHHRAMWALAIGDVAQEMTESLAHLAPDDRKLAMRKATIMSSSVTALLSNDPLPRPQPSAVSPIIRPNMPHRH